MIDDDSYFVTGKIIKHILVTIKLVQYFFFSVMPDEVQTINSSSLTSTDIITEPGIFN